MVVGWLIDYDYSWEVPAVVLVMTKKLKNIDT